MIHCPHQSQQPLWISVDEGSKNDSVSAPVLSDKISDLPIRIDRSGNQQERAVNCWKNRTDTFEVVWVKLIVRAKVAEEEPVSGSL